MARLRSPRQERFARLVAAGADPAAAYGEAGYRGGKPEGRAAVLVELPTVKARIAALRVALNAELGASPVAVAGSVAGGPVGAGGDDGAVGDREGETGCDARPDGGDKDRASKAGPGRDWVIARLVETAERALQAVPVTDRKGEPTGEFTYQGSVALRALELLGRELGMFSDKKEPGEGGVEALSDDDLERRAVKLAQALGLGGLGGDP